MGIADLAILARLFARSWAILIAFGATAGPALALEQEVGFREVAAALDRGLGDPDPHVRRSSLNSIRDLDLVSRMLESVESLLTDADSAVRRVAAETLGRRPRTPNLVFDASSTVGLRDANATRRAIKALRAPGAEERWRAANKLGNLRDPRAVEALILALSDGDPAVRRGAVSALGNIRSPAAADRLVDLLTDPDPETRYLVANALGNIAVPSSVSGLLEAYPDTNSDVRSAIASALGSIGDPTGGFALIRALADENVDVRRAAAEALGRLRIP